MMSKEQAQQKAGEKLDRLELAMRRATYATIAGAVAAWIVALCAAFAAVEYIRMKSAMAEASAKASEGLSKLRMDLGKPITPARKPLVSPAIPPTKSEGP